MDIHLLAYYIGILIIFGSHTYMLCEPGKPLTTKTQHCYLNIFAGILIAYYFLHKERYIHY